MSTNTREDNSLQRHRLMYEQTPTDIERIYTSWSRSIIRIALTVNKNGLLPLMRFGRR